MAHEQRSESNDSSTLNIAVILSALIFIFGGYLFLSSAKPVTKESFNFEPLTIDANKLAQERTQRYGSEIDLDDARIKRLTDVIRQANAEQFVEMDDDKKRTRAKEIQVAADEVLEMDEMRGFHAIGTDFFTKCDAGLTSALQAFSQKQDLTVLRTDGAHEQYREYCGDLIPHLQRLKLVDEKGTWVDPTTGPEMVTLMNRYRWAFIHARREPVWKQMTPYEYELFERWRVSASDSFPAEDRIKFAKRAGERLPSFPTDDLVARIYIQGDDLQSAHPFMARVCAKKTAKTIDTCRWFEEELAKISLPTDPAPH